MSSLWEAQVEDREKFVISQSIRMGRGQGLRCLLFPGFDAWEVINPFIDDVLKSFLSSPNPNHRSII